MNYWRSRFYHSNYFPVALLLFIAGYYVISQSKWHNNIYYAFLLLPFLVAFPWSSIKTRLASPIMAVACLLILYLLASLLWSPIEDAGDIKKTFSHALYVFIFLLLGTDVLLRRPEFFERLFFWLGWLVIVAGPVSIVLFYQDHPFPQARLITLGRFDHPGWAAMMYGFIGLYHFLDTLQTKANTWRRWLPGGLAALLSLAVVLLGQSRGVLAALLLTLLAGALLSRQRRYWLMLMLAAAVFLLLAWWWKLDLWTILHREGGWDSHRLEIWRQAIDLIRQAPVLGYGILEHNTFPLYSGITQPHAHNILLSACLYGGLIAGSLVLLLMGLVLRQGWRYWNCERDIRPLLITLFGLIYMMTDGYKLISSPWPNWLYFWLPVIWAAANQSYPNKQRD